MRVSTVQFYYQSALQMSDKNTDLNEQMAYLSSGKRVMTAKDDAVAYSTLAGYKEGLSNIEQFKRNITQSESHNNLQDVMFSNAETALDKIRQDLILANNGRMSTEDLQTFADQVNSALEEILDIANTQNENGDYIFSGYNIEQKPFSQEVDGSVTYQGDSGVRELQVAQNIKIASNQPGDAVFQDIANATGDFSASYTTNTSGVALEQANVTDRNTYNTSAIPHDYTFTFDAITGDLDVTDSGGASVATASPYVAGQTISFDGVDVTLSGNPLPGDTFTISEDEEVSIFETINDAITWMEKGSVTTNQEQHQVDFNTMLNQLNSAMVHITARRVDAGLNLQVLENQTSRHLDTELNLNTNKGKIEDLDFASAISAFEQSKVALQASQQVFTKVQSLNLFNYI